ncbi:hypothetical protein TraAM80_03726 [Trypanosoma rangeli]|uniref:Uncharacterized protein n=1 Tax=Trypanosoma rangeli TaxID=5698 RepID=A0A3R7L3M0_TRYRA|nr:uncharacterized protein TraAM80_03726 [Trypanosoma rangeli]RNF06910.1 hypothetical protein TraAM80_03726 [Trypanosoma rangeli]|eukprot:RNF06910.1 hypothetical protein TraAM80_03726 [Trypanosoma rangeli]
MCSTGKGLALQQQDAYNWRLKEAQAAKERGNAVQQVKGTRPIDEKKLREAVFSYQRGCMYLAEYLPETTDGVEENLQDMLVSRQRRARRCPLDEKQLTEVVDLYAALQKNLALVNYRLGRYAKGVECATAVLALPGCANDKKALLRRAFCNCSLTDFVAAEADLDALERLCKDENAPLDPSFQELRGKISTARREALEKERRMCKKMFASEQRNK